MCPQASFSQAATWPPSAAVRQFSMALITLNWPGLTWPRLAWRHAAPWPRKMSATSRDGRAMAAGYSGGLPSFGRSGVEPVERARDLRGLMLVATCV